VAVVRRPQVALAGAAPVQEQEGEGAVARLQGERRRIARAGLVRTEQGVWVTGRARAIDGILGDIAAEGERRQ